MDQKDHQNLAQQALPGDATGVGALPAASSSAPPRSSERQRTQLGRLHGIHVTAEHLHRVLQRFRNPSRFGYMTPHEVRAASRLEYNPQNVSLLTELGAMMADAGREPAEESSVLAGLTYVGQFIAHDITFDVSPPHFDAPVDADQLPNMRSPALDLDSVYGDGPTLSPYLYVMPSGSANPTAIRLRVGVNKPSGRGGPSGNPGPAGTTQLLDFDVPRLSPGVTTAVIGDPRNDENLIISQLHHAFLRFHNAVVDRLEQENFPNDIFAEATKRVIQHYQYAVVHDFLTQICGQEAVDDALKTVKAEHGGPFRMPVEFSAAAFRFGHSMVRERYWLSFVAPKADLVDVFRVVRTGLPLESTWVVDLNGFFDTGVAVPKNRSRKIDSVLAQELENIPGGKQMMAVLATRNLLRGLVLGLPSGQATARYFNLPPLEGAALLEGLDFEDEVRLLEANERLLHQTPLWYYVLREAKITRNGDSLGPLGARIVAETVVRILARQPHSFLNDKDFTLSLKGSNSEGFTFADLLRFSGVLRV